MNPWRSDAAAAAAEIKPIRCGEMRFFFNERRTIYINIYNIEYKNVLTTFLISLHVKLK